mmetsp:Transcript_72871/g.202128  ORF Transcript_72871/g.202128 Transcript_72871/m.202128 type:complete len:238 (+) Transcript_72871:31-744(+)
MHRKNTPKLAVVSQQARRPPAPGGQHLGNTSSNGGIARPMWPLALGGRRYSGDFPRPRSRELLQLRWKGRGWAQEHDHWPVQAGLRFLRKRCYGLDRPVDCPLARQGGILNNGHGRVARRPMFPQALADALKGFQAHVKHHGLLIGFPGKLIPAELWQLPCFGLTDDETNLVGAAPVGERHLARSRRPQRRRDAGNYLRGHPVLRKKFQFLATPAEDERIPALQANDLSATTAMSNK